MAWMLLVLLYGLLKGCREITKKLAMQTSSVMEVLVVYTFISFLLVTPQAKFAGGMEVKFYFLIALKSFFIFLAWIFSFHSLKRLPVSLYGVLDLSRVLFATFLGIVFLHESLRINQIFGLAFVCAGLLLLRFKPKFLCRLFRVQETPAYLTTNLPKDNTRTFFVILALASCMLNSLSGFLDKILMKDITSSQLQFWYMLFLISYYILYILITREKIHLSVLKNKYIWIMALMFVIADKALFIANGMEGSRVTIMTLIKQSGCLITIIGGKLIFKESNTAYKLFCAFIVILGILLGVL